MEQFSGNFNMKINVWGWLLVIALLAGCANNAEKPNTPTEQKREKTTTSPEKEKGKTIVFYGNSLTAGYGVDPSEAFPAIVQTKVDSLQLPYKVINAGLSGETTAGGRSRIDWILRQPVNVFVLELGGNDGLRGIPISETEKNLQAIIDKVKAKYPDATIILAGMQIPPNMGRKYTNAFREVFQQLAAKNNITLIPFLLEHVGGIASLNQNDGIHPNPEGHKIVAENVWKVLQGVISDK
jgi:acyl-CoA thioesterase I